eukprot:GEMP01018927.1.p1 GENE.GEMP01018927.1~~GEMP01018927.1.p1  ORF type:complete len:639 (+),score=173.85 GEMP01018927.1:128-2044(+)
MRAYIPHMLPLRRVWPRTVRRLVARSSTTCASHASSHNSSIARATLIPSTSTNDVVTPPPQARGVTLTWATGETVDVHTLWLRINRPDRITANGQRQFEIPTALPPVLLTHAAVDNNGDALEVTWADGDSTKFPATWLYEHCGGESSSKKRTQDERFLWNATLGRGCLPRVDYGDHTGVGLARALHAFGLCVIKNVPTESGMVEKVGNDIGFVRRTNYGSRFDVRDDGAAAKNLAYTSVAVGSHTDNPYRDPNLGFQLLHMLQPTNCGGGFTTFCDGFAVAKRLQARSPKKFALLTQIPHPFTYSDRDLNVHLTCSVPVINCDADGTLTRIAFNNRSAAAICPTVLPFEDIEPYYDAWSAFDTLANSDEFVLKIALEKGDLVIFDNTRVLHGRTAFSSDAALPVRHLQGCYIDKDAVLSRLHDADDKDANSGGMDDIDPHARMADEILEALRSQEEFSYGESISMLDHALQAAHFASEEEEKLACLVHDIGNTTRARHHWEFVLKNKAVQLLQSADGSIGYEKHGTVGAHYLESRGFSARVVSAANLHIKAKRALVTMDPSYMDKLSEASKATLLRQGGPMTREELDTFSADVGSEMALKLRLCDDLGKDVGLKGRVMPLEDYRDIIVRHLRSSTSAE